MKKRVVVLLFALSVTGLSAGQERATQKTSPAIKYGANTAAGRTFTHDGVKLYYEVYGAGEPLLLVHGNGGSIVDLSAQIRHFRARYRVIAMDSRDQGKSSDSPDKLTYEKMADDLAALLDHLKAGPAYVLGWSDGGIEALLLGIRHPTKVKKIAAMAANLNPSEDALSPDVIALVKTMISGVPAAVRDTPQGRRELKVTAMMLEEPHIELKALEVITAPTLILAGDHDLIRDEHTLDIYHHIPNSQLAIFPNATHMVPFDDPALFNATVERFFRAPFVKKDRINDALKSLEKIRAQTRQTPPASPARSSPNARPSAGTQSPGTQTAGTSAQPPAELRTHVERLAGPQPTDCGQHFILTPFVTATAEETERSLTCAIDSAKDRKPFWTFKQEQGIDSLFFQGLLGTAEGATYRFTYDSAPCGGPGCPGRFDIERCDKPIVVTASFRCQR